MTEPRQFIRAIDSRYVIPPGIHILRVIGWEDVLSGDGGNCHRVYICIVEERDD